MSSPQFPLSVLFLWHQHQPLYKDTLADTYELPWVRLHATKDYYDMVALLEEFPKIRANFNLVPSLLAQLDDYAHGKATDKFLSLTVKSASDLAYEDRLFILQNFFMANWDTMIDPHPRYRELLDKRGRRISLETLARTQNYYTEQDWRDLQMWFNLAWFDPWWQEKDPLIRAFYGKGKGFSEDDKQKLAAKQEEICGQIVSKHRQMQESGQIEVTTSPFYHPILPLLCDTDAAKAALPHLRMPHRFRHPEDAASQLRRAIDDYQKRFGRPPAGLWPSEGSVSPEAAALIIQAGIQWVATDEAVLAKSLHPAPFSREDLYEPYQYTLNGKTLTFFFRDHELSDAIGFVYSSWEPQDAAQDFMKRLRDIRTRLHARDGGANRPHVVPIILDGENCWEYYKEDGLPFLRALYTLLSEDASFETVRGTDFLNRAQGLKTLPQVWPGSWINANFAIWIGHSEDNRAWDLLNRTREFLEAQLRDHPELRGTPQIVQAWEEIYIAEGSDWCWWYGDDHSCANDETFDHLFRKHLMNVHTLLAAKIPEDLYLPIKAKRKAEGALTAPIDFIAPVLDGRITNYFEWQSAGRYETEAGATGTMHRAQNLIKTIYFGYDLNSYYVRLDADRALTSDLLAELSLKVTFLSPENVEINGRFTPDKAVNLELIRASGEPVALPNGTVHKIIEFGIPIEVLEVQGNEIALFLVILKGGVEQERWPLETPIRLPLPTPDTFSESWVV